MIPVSELQAPFGTWVEALDSGQYLAVHPHVDALIKLGTPTSTLLAVRALRYLGADRQGEVLVHRLGQRFPTHPAVLIALYRSALGRLGAYGAWRLAQHRPWPGADDPVLEAEWCGLNSLWMASVRDFERADQWWARAQGLCPDDPWIWTERAYGLERADRYEEALDAVAKALSLRPGYRAAWQFRAHLWTLQGHRARARQSLEQQVDGSTCSGVALQLFAMQFDEQDVMAASHSLDLAELWMPRADRFHRGLLDAKRADLAMAQGQWEVARRHARAVPGRGFYQRMAERDIPEPFIQRRVLLQVDFVRQHWATCAPATLASLCRYWGIEARHPDIAQEICYDGTTDVAERRWVASHGLCGREFRLTWDTAVALLDAGVPFTLVTQFAGGAHLQAVVGYDLMRGTLLIRDPYQPVHAEMEANSLLESHVANGPRAMLVLPETEMYRVERVVLPDAEAWDQYHRVVASLDGHDRVAAMEALTTLRTQWPETLLRWRGERALAIYDGAEQDILRATEALLGQAPHDINLQLSRMASLWNIGGKEASTSVLRDAAGEVGAEPLMLCRWAERLAEDGRCLTQALQVMRRALRRGPFDGRLWGQMASLLWQGQGQTEAMELFRWAATLQPTDEGAASAYMRACLLQGHIDTGLQFLQARWDHLGDRSSAPALSLFDQLDALERHDDAFVLLEQAMQRRPQDSALKVAAAERYLRIRRVDEARRCLREADQPVKPAERYRVEAMLADQEGDSQNALALALRAVEVGPLGLPALRLAASLLSRVRGREEALAWLHARGEAYPCHWGLHRLIYDWLPDDAQAINAQLERMNRAHPDEPWLIRELAVQAARQARFEDATRMAEAALKQSPKVSESHSVMAFVCLRQHGWRAAEPHLREALRLHVDNDYAMRNLLAAPSLADGRRSAEFALAELLHQVTSGDGLLLFASEAQRILPAEELGKLLAQALEERSDLWHAWVAQSQFWVWQGQVERAQQLLEQAVVRFPVVPRLWVELSSVLRQQGQRDAALGAVEKALAISPQWNRAVRLHVDLSVEIHGAQAAPKAVLGRALQLAPQDADLLGLMAWLLERQGDRHAALEKARASVAQDPTADWVWQLIRRLAEAAEDMAWLDDSLGLVARVRPGDPWAWLAAARHGRDGEQALSAAVQACERDPRLVAAWEARFDRLMRIQRYDEVLSLVGQLPWPQSAPVSLRAFAAKAHWALGQRAKALQTLQSLLEESPHLPEMWQLQADWSDAMDDLQTYERAADEMVRLAPTWPLAPAYLGHARCRSGRHADALPLLQRAQMLDPTYAFAAYWAAEAALQVQDPVALDAAIECLWPHEGSVRLASLGARYLAKLRCQTPAQKWMQRLLACESYDTEATILAATAFKTAGWGGDLKIMQRAALASVSCPTGVMVDWLANCRRQGGILWSLWQLRAWLKASQNPAVHRGAVRWLHDQRATWTLRLVVARNDARLRRDDLAWGDVSFALLDMHQTKQVVHWMSDWRHRPTAPVWALGNLCAAAIRLDRPRLVREVVKTTLHRAPTDAGLRFWQLVSTTLEGDWTAARQLMGLQHEWVDEDWMKPSLEMIQATLACVAAGDSAPGARLFSLISPRCGAEALAIRRQLAWMLVRRFTPWWKRPLRFVQMVLA